MENQCKILQLEKEKLLPEGLQETNTGDGENIRVWAAFQVAAR
jgi:hypothetical protein